MADDELEAMQAIYCRPGELYMSCGADNSRRVTVNIKSMAEESSDPHELELGFFLSSSYPLEAPTISLLSNQLSKYWLSQLRTSMNEAASQNIGEPMLLQLTSLATEELHKATQTFKLPEKQPKRMEVSASGEDTTTGSERCGNKNVLDQDRVVLLHLDHMRAKNQYVKFINKWVAELGLRGRLLFCQRLILILLQGPSSAIKEYLVRQRTNKVDVDSKGHPCKERMLSVVCDTTLASSYTRIEDFDILEEMSMEDLQSFFKRLDLEDMFQKQVRTLKHFPGKS